MLYKNQFDNYLGLKLTFAKIFYQSHKKFCTYLVRHLSHNSFTSVNFKEKKKKKGLRPQCVIITIVIIIVKFLTVQVVKLFFFNSYICTIKDTFEKFFSTRSLMY